MVQITSGSALLIAQNINIGRECSDKNTINVCFSCDEQVVAKNRYYKTHLLNALLLRMRLFPRSRYVNGNDCARQKLISRIDQSVDE